MNGVKHSGSRESILVVADSFFPVRIPDRADDEKGVKLPLAYISLVDAVTALGSMAGTIIVDCFQSLPDDLAVTATTHLIITPRGHVAVVSGKTLTINGRVTILSPAPFAGPGSVAYGANAMRNVMGPANMSGMAGKGPIVNVGEDGFEWGSPGGGAAWGDITGTLANQADLDAALDEKAPVSHEHAESDVAGLVSDLAGKAAASHGHGPSDITGIAVITTDARLSDARTPLAHGHAGADISSGTVDGDRLPALSATKKGGAPATGNPSGKYLKDDGTWAAPAGGGFEFPIGWGLISWVDINPATFLGYGTWVKTGAGRVLVGLDASDPDFDTVKELVGAKTSTPSQHAGAAVAGHAEKATGAASAGASKRGTTTDTLTQAPHTHQVGAYVHEVTQASNHAAMSVVQPSIVVYFWERIA